MKNREKSREKEKKRLEGQVDRMRRWLTTMPLSAGGHERNLQYIQDFALLLAHLVCPPNSRVLEIGAGSCWATEWLARLGFKVVSLDINLDMLRLGRERFDQRPGGPESEKLTGWFAVGDGETLPFRDGSFQAVFTLNSLHHIPDIPRVIKEVHRLLEDGGRFLFVEPGEGHSTSPEALREMEELGVLEQDIIIDQVMQWAVEAGFQGLHIIPSSDPFKRLPLHEWHRLQRPWWMQPRELRRLKEELISWNSRHPAVLFIKGSSGEDAPGRLAGKIIKVESPREVGSREIFRVDSRLENTGSLPWQSWRSYLESSPLNQGEGGHVALGLKLKDMEGAMLDSDLARGQLLQDIQPGETAEVAALVKAPGEPGEYIIKVDLVQEGVAWFEDLGGAPAQISLSVRRSEERTFPDSRLPDSLLAEMSLDEAGGPGEQRFVLTVRNTGDTLWLHAPRDEPGIPSHKRGFVSLGVQALGEDRQVLNRDHQRISLPADLPPGGKVTLTFKLEFGTLPEGTAFLKLDMVNEGVCWFESRGSTPLVAGLDR